MSSNVVSMNRYKAIKQYQLHSVDCSFNLALDTVPYKHTQPRGIAKEMVKSYLKLLSK